MLDKQSSVPMYVQIEDYLKKQIIEGGFVIGIAIPSERELTDIFSVSRMTVRQSISNLVNEGLLYREKGRGTFVATPKIEQPLIGLTSFTEDMLSRGMKPSNKLISFEKMIPEMEIAYKLQLSRDEEVFVVKRIRFADNKPMAIERSYLPVKLVPDLELDKIEGSLYSFIEKDKRLTISHASQRMEAVLVKKEDAEFLEIRMPSAVLMMERTSYLTNDVPFEIVRSTYRADRYKFISEIRR
ncbi:GntR family transcriptional regulator [Sporosarcina sp. ANT_H38]|uniref:GntR family transcriptional regulator n=1 Tax=Sporosarcina sp. ANT_H38 TaxID=2597358 RepID=UPI0011F0A186|nr:GntR family transcriptional regulator [Sporosarcina sp. ANT_H38]KAA0965318.1 GntR family transcriptional regulator [Sporosarcina sp. ANT_H38]